MNSGDQHNFGKKTEFATVNGVGCYVKPRPIYWEWLFAGSDSPIASVIRSNEKLNKYLGPIFSLDVTYVKKEDLPFELSGHVQKIESLEVKQLNGNDNIQIRRLFESFGAICAYAYCFGLHDLNFENILIRQDGTLQLIDIEISFIPSKFLGTTGMISDGSSISNFASYSSVLKSVSCSFIDFLPYLLDAYHETILALFQARGMIRSVLNPMMNELLQVPIRAVLRDTQTYFIWLVKHGFVEPVKLNDSRKLSESEEKVLLSFQNAEVSFFPEELEQLERGDIPYFFSFLESSDIFFLKTATGDMAKIESSEGLARLQHYTKPRIDLDWRFSEERLIDSCLPAGLVELLWDLLPREYTGTFEARNLSFVVNEHVLRINDHLNKKVYIAERSYDPNSVEEFIRARAEIIVMHTQG